MAGISLALTMVKNTTKPPQDGDIDMKKKDDWFDSHVEVIGLSPKRNKKIKDALKKKLIDESGIEKLATPKEK